MSNQVDIMKMDPQSLNELKKSLTDEIQLLTGQFGNLKLALNKYRMSLSSIDGLASAQGADKEVLVPVTTALYLPGKINKVQSVLVEVGTGYFVEKQLDAAQTYVASSHLSHGVVYICLCFVLIHSFPLPRSHMRGISYAWHPCCWKKAVQRRSNICVP